MGVLCTLLASCYTATLVTLTAASDADLSVDGGGARLTDADVERVKQIAVEVAKHFEFVPAPAMDADSQMESADRLGGRLLAHYSYAGLTPTPIYLSLHLPSDRSHLTVAIHDLSHSVERTQIVRLLEADFARLLKEAFPGYEVKLE